MLFIGQTKHVQSGENVFKFMTFHVDIVIDSLVANEKRTDTRKLASSERMQQIFHYEVYLSWNYTWLITLGF